MDWLRRDETLVISAVRTKKNDGKSGASRRQFVIKPREPWELPDQSIEIPAPSRLPASPAPLNLLTMLLPPVLMMVAYGIVIAFMSASGSTSTAWPFFLVMPLVGLGMPIANYISHKNQTKKYHEALRIREKNYQAELAKTRTKLDALATQQRESLNREYPLLPRLIQTGLGISHQKRLWWRRMADPDFLSLRMGTGNDKASFTVIPPRVIDPEDPLAPLAQEIVQRYREIPDTPLLLAFLKVGSVGLSDRSGETVYGLARRFMLDIITHHSPQDVQVMVLGDTPQARDRWEWLKWAPHTRAIYQGESNRRLAFDAIDVDKCVEWLMIEFENRTRPEPGVRKRNASRSAIVVLLDDSGDIRRTDDIRQLAESGRDADIYLMFIGGQNWPRECRAKIDVSEGEFKYTETFIGDGGGKRLQGKPESVSIVDCERVARALAGLEISSGGGRSSLPESVRLFDVLGPGEVGPETLKQNWTRARTEDELLQFPFGLRNGRKGLEPVLLNLLPPGPEYPGIGAYHTLLVGTTGSGKSEFMKSLVLSAAYKYSPRQLNFFFMDFKGGAAFSILKDLPHVVGVVTNLRPQLVERGLSALEAEFERRQKRFADAAASNIWAYNEKYPETPIPHLMLLLDEFARGMSDFPRLPEMLDKLVRIGRSLGVYLLLANQDVNSQVDHLLNNVGWHIALKVARQEEMHVIDRSLPKVERTGQGYLHSQDGDIYEFQAAYAGFSVADKDENVKEEAFRIYRVESDGKWQPLYSNARRPSAAEKDRRRPKEQEQLISMMKDLSDVIEPAPLIYLEPLESNIPLETVMQESGVRRAFVDGKWSRLSSRGRLVAPIGYTDSTEECVQEPLQIDFEDQDGHLWLIGAASSGKAMIIETLLLSLALSNTPEDAWFYILDFGVASRFQYFKSLPHCGAVITPNDPVEMIDRLLQFLDDEMTRRASQKEKRSFADIFLVINNFYEFRDKYPDHAERIVPYINGKAMGIHLVIATNRRMELLNKLVIARKIVLRLANRDEYSDAIGGRVTVLPVVQAEGRGLWVDGKPVECQIAQPIVVLETDNRFSLNSESACNVLTKAWGESLPHAPQIKVLPLKIPLAGMLEKIESSSPENISIPIGMSFETMQMVSVNLLKEIPRWLVLGPPRSGKSNFLSSIANSVHVNDSKNWDIRYFSLRRPIPLSIGEHIRTATSVTEASQMLDEVLDIFERSTKSEKQFLLLMDDLGAFFEPGREVLPIALNSIALKASSREDVIIVGAGLPDELRPHQMTSKLVQSLKLSRTGICFSKDSSDLDLLSARVPFHYMRLDIPPGRGFWISGGKSVLVQSPWSG